MSSLKNNLMFLYSVTHQHPIYLLVRISQGISSSSLYIEKSIEKFSITTPLSLPLCILQTMLSTTDDPYFINISFHQHCNKWMNRIYLAHWLLKNNCGVFFHPQLKNSNNSARETWYNRNCFNIFYRQGVGYRGWKDNKHWKFL